MLASPAKNSSCDEPDTQNTPPGYPCSPISRRADDATACAIHVLPMPVIPNSTTPRPPFAWSASRTSSSSGARPTRSSSRRSTAMFVMTPSISQTLICPVQSMRLDGGPSRSSIPLWLGVGGGTGGGGGLSAGPRPLRFRARRAIFVATSVNARSRRLSLYRVTGSPSHGSTSSSMRLITGSCFHAQSRMITGITRSPCAACRASTSGISLSWMKSDARNAGLTSSSAMSACCSPFSISSRQSAPGSMRSSVHTSTPSTLRTTSRCSRSSSLSFASLWL